MKLRTILAAAAALVTISAAQSRASIIVTPGNTGSLPDDNVVSAVCTGGSNGPSLTIVGCLNSDHTKLVNFTSDENILFGAGGQATIEASDGGFSYLNIGFQSGTFASLILDIQASADGTVTFAGVPGGSSSTFAISKSGSNFFTITGENFSTVSFNTTVDIVADVKQVRLGSGTTVPEPVSMALLGSGLIGFGVVRLRSRG